MYHILRRADGTIKTFGQGRGEDWDEPDCTIEIVKGNLADVEDDLTAQLTPDPIAPEEQAELDQRAADRAAVAARAAQDPDFAALARMLGLKGV